MTDYTNDLDTNEDADPEFEFDNMDMSDEEWAWNEQQAHLAMLRS